MRNFILAVSLLAVACGGSPTEPSGTAILNIQLTDTPFVNALAVLVTFDKVSVHRAEGGWIDLDKVSFPRTCDLKQLVNVETNLINPQALEAGHYTQIRLNVVRAALDFEEEDLNAICFDGDNPMLSDPPDSAPLEISSGLVILNRQFTLVENEVTTLTLDFDGDRSIREAPPGSYRMSPVISVVSMVQP